MADKTSIYNKAENFMYSANEGATEHMLKNTAYAYVDQKTEKEAYLVTNKPVTGLNQSRIQTFKTWKMCTCNGIESLFTSCLAASHREFCLFALLIVCVSACVRWFFH